MDTRRQPIDCGLIRWEILHAIAATRSYRSLGCQTGRLEGGPDALAALWVGAAGGITDEQQPVSEDGACADARGEDGAHGTTESPDRIARQKASQAVVAMRVTPLADGFAIQAVAATGAACRPSRRGTEVSVDEHGRDLVD